MANQQSAISDQHSGELIRTVNLTKVYGSGENAVKALDGVNLTVQRGELMAVMGPSGCGKSTLLNLLGALDQPTAGEVWVAGENLARLRDVDAFRAGTVGFVFQLHNLLPTLSALENVEVPMQGQPRSGKPAPDKSRSGEPARDRPMSHRSRHERARHLLELVGLADRPNALPAQLSGGQRQRVAVARALANDPALLLADEPTGSLDSQSGEEILDLLAELDRIQGSTILIHAAHSPHERRPHRRRSPPDRPAGRGPAHPCRQPAGPGHPGAERPPRGFPDGGRTGHPAHAAGEGRGRGVGGPSPQFER
jgi:putative ABC transport system ATP-binding protein